MSEEKQAVSPLIAKTTELKPCCDCGGKPYEYDMREIDTIFDCTVECGGCERSVEGDTPEEAAAAWNAGESH